MCPGCGVRNHQLDATAAHRLADLINAATAKQQIGHRCDVACQRDRQRMRAAAAVVIADGRNADGVETRREDLVGIAAGEYRDLVIARQGRQYRPRPPRVTEAVAHHVFGRESLRERVCQYKWIRMADATTQKTRGKS